MANQIANQAIPRRSMTLMIDRWWSRLLGFWKSCECCGWSEKKPVGFLCFSWLTSTTSRFWSTSHVLVFVSHWALFFRPPEQCRISTKPFTKSKKLPKNTGSTSFKQWMTQGYCHIIHTYIYIYMYYVFHRCAPISCEMESFPTKVLLAAGRVLRPFRSQKEWKMWDVRDGKKSLIEPWKVPWFISCGHEK